MNRKSRVIVRRHRNEKYHKQFLAARVQGGGGSIGIWGAIIYHGTGLHQLYEGRLNRFGYIDILENALIPSRDLYFTENDEWYLQQDNAPCHTAYDVQDWFDENKIKVITWPARSPDLNIIENVWAWIDRYLDQYACTTLSQLKDKLTFIWNSIKVEHCQNLYKSIRRRCQLCIRNRGGHIPY
jgi:hypothetical protein